MQRIVVDKKVDIFDYVVEFAIKQHKQPNQYGWESNIAENHYEIKFCGANGRAYRCFKAKFNCEPDRKYVAQILKWRKGNDEIEMSISYKGKKYNHVRPKRRYLSVNYIVVNGRQVFKCRPCWSSNREKDECCNHTWRYWFEY